MIRPAALVLLSLTLVTRVGAVDLSGLWKAKRNFGPDARGILLMERSGNAFFADFQGRTIPVPISHGELSFDAPLGGGTFRGRLLDDGAIAGHWFSPRYSALGFPFASPVLLATTGPNRWRGTVAPLDDTFTFSLQLRKRDDGSYDALLRNIERDFGNAIGARRLVLEGASVRLLDAQNRSRGQGSYDGERDSFRLDFPERGGIYEFQRDANSAFYPREKNARYSYRPPPTRDDGWRTASVEEENIDRGGIERFLQRILDMPMEDDAALQIHGILIARHGRLVVEEYFHGEHRDELHETRSAAKSVTATLIGAAMHNGAPLQLSSPVYSVMNGGSFPPDLDPRKRAMTLEHLLTNRSGFFCDDTNPEAPGNEDAMLDQESEPDYWRFALGVPLATAPGEKSVYCSINPNLALGVLAHATGESPLVTFDRLLGRPMKIDRYAWLLDPAGNPYGGGSMQFLPRDFLKFGQLMLDGGVWNGRRLLDRAFVERASSCLTRIRNLDYGLLWWGIDLPYKSRNVHAFFAGGSGGQSVIVIPELSLAVATFGGNYSTPGTITITHTLVPRFVLPSVREKGDDPHAPVEERDFTSPYGK